MLQRDAFISVIHRALEVDKEIFFLSADFGAAALDDLRIKYKDNFVHCGISEQAMIDVATGLALEGKKVFCYAMAPFLSLRALEQIKCGPGIMKLPICLISVGVGIGYADSGPTHYVTEDFACLRAIVGASVYTASDSPTAEKLAQRILSNPHFSYVRLDRHALPDLSSDYTCEDFRVFGTPSSGKVAIVSHGRMLHECVQVSSAHPDKFYAVDLIRSKPFPSDLLNTLSDARGILAVDEQSPSGALGSAIFEGCSNSFLFPRLLNLTLPEAYLFDNHGRDGLLADVGLTQENIYAQASRLIL